MTIVRSAPAIEQYLVIGFCHMSLNESLNFLKTGSLGLSFLIVDFYLSGSFKKKREIALNIKPMNPIIYIDPLHPT